MLQTPADFDLWKNDIPTKGFDLSFKDYHDKLHVAANNCCRFEFPIAAGRIPEGMRCPECHRLMEKYIAFLCCHDQTGLLEPY
ncbi:putative sieve element occlusion [Helianthus annuus]|nr:putative sieve element occlusion [Helianthus annuus]